MVVLSYLGFLGWVRGLNVWGRDEYDDAYNAYTAWQVIAVVLVLALCAGWAGTHQARWTGSITAALTITLCYFFDGWNEVSDGLWGVAIPPIFAITFVGFFAVATGCQAWASRRAAAARARKTAGPVARRPRRR